MPSVSTNFPMVWPGLILGSDFGMFLQPGFGLDFGESGHVEGHCLDLALACGFEDRADQMDANRLAVLEMLDVGQVTAFLEMAGLSNSMAEDSFLLVEERFGLGKWHVPRVG